jgi:hypothetical protein
MSSLRQHFQHIKEIVDWTWTLAIMCLVGYISLGQLAQLYWAMVFFGGLAASFGLFYDFSCEQLAALNYIEDSYQLQKATADAAIAQDLLRKFHNRNPEIANRFPQFIQIKNQVSQIRTTSANKSKQQVYRQTQTPPRNSSQSSSQKPIQPIKLYRLPKTETQYQSQNPVQPMRSSSPPKRQSQIDHRNPEVATRFPEFVQLRNYVYVKPHVRNNVLVKGYYRKKPII